MASLLRELLNDEVGTSALAGSRPSWSERLGSRHWEGERTRCSLGGDGSIMCGEAGCLHCGFTPATSHLLFKTIINCSIIQMIFTRANYTGPHPAEKMAGVFYCCTCMRKSALLRLFKWGSETFGWTCFLRWECLHTHKSYYEPSSPL